MTTGERRRAVVVAGHRGDIDVVIAHLDDDQPSVRASALNALERLEALTSAQLGNVFADPAPTVRRRVAELAGRRSGLSLEPLLRDDDTTVVEAAAWACGEQEDVDDDVLDRLIDLTTSSPEALVREACAAALGAIGDPRGRDAVLSACTDKPHVRRRAVLALAPFEGDEVEAAIERALADRDWQVRQAAEDLRRAAGEVDLA